MTPVAADLLVIGPGWLGGPLAAALAAAASPGGPGAPSPRVWSLRRSPGPPPDRCHGLLGDITSATIDAAVRSQGVQAVAQVIVAVAPSRARGDSYALYPAAAEGARRLATALGARQLLWISSTGVYGEQAGGVVTETTPLPADRDARVEALIAAEAIVHGAEAEGIRSVVLRPAGLYGPGRDPAPRFRTGAGPLDRWCNFSWRDDVIAAVVHLLRHPPAHPATYNCTDDMPVEAWRIVEALTGATPPAGGAGADATPTTRSNQQVSSAALLATGWRPTVRSIFDGLERLGHALPGRLPAGAPYGPNTPSIRRFLQRLAGLGATDAASVVSRYQTAIATRPWQQAERALGDAVARSGRTPMRDAVAGPLLQLVRRPTVASEDLLASLEPLAEPALAAVLLLLVEDVLAADLGGTLYAPFEPVIPRRSLDQAAR